MKNRLNAILEQLEDPKNDAQSLGYQALDIIKDILEETPFDIDKRSLRMRLNNDIFQNTSEVINDAEFIINNDEFKQDKMFGYDWLFWIYNDVLVLPEKAEEVITEQLIEIQTLYTKKPEKDKKEGEVLDVLANLYFKKNEKEKALNTWYKSYEKDPYLNHRNGIVGIQFLKEKEWEKAAELLLTHFNWSFNSEDGYRLEYGKVLKELYDKGEIDNQPTLIGLLFNVIRNEKYYFKIEGRLDFHDQYLPVLLKHSEKYPDNILINNAIANSYLLDVKNYEKAYAVYKKLVPLENGLKFTTLSRVYKAAKKSNNIFFELPFSFDNLANELYSNLTDASSIVKKTNSKKKKKKAAELAIKFGEVCYNKYRGYLVDGNDDTHSNQPHIFAMLCNNYANALGVYANLHLKKEAKAIYYDRGGNIHLEGYKSSPFIENIQNASHSYFSAKNYKKSIECSLQTFQDYKEELSVYDYQSQYWQIVRSYIYLDDLENAEKYYFIAKKLLLKVGKGSKESTNEFIFMSKLFYEFAVTEKKEFQKIIPEMEWFLEEKIALKQEPKEHGLISYYLGICYKENNRKENAINAFQVTVDLLQNEALGFYDTKCDEAEACINELGGKVIKEAKSPKKEKSVLKKTWQIITFPFMIFAIIGGFIWAATKQKKKKKRRKK